MKNRELDNMLDRIASGIRAERIDDNLVSQASDRVWTRMSDASRMLADRPQNAGAPTGASGRIEGCADFQSIIPAYLSGELSKGRSLLLVDHTHECVPCRRAMKQARENRVT